MFDIKSSINIQKIIEQKWKGIYGILKIYVEEGVYICKYLYLDDIYVIINLKV